MTEPAGLTAVVCDDASDQREAVSQALLRAGYEVVAETTTVAMLRRIVAQAHPDVVVIDLARSGREGLAAVRELCALSPKSAVIALSPFASLRDDALAAGVRALVDGSDLRRLEAALALLRTPSQREPSAGDARWTQAGQSDA